MPGRCGEHQRKVTMLMRLNPFSALRVFIQGETAKIVAVSKGAVDGSVSSVSSSLSGAEGRLHAALLGCEDRTRAGVAEVKGYIESAIDESEARILNAMRAEFEALQAKVLAGRSAPIPAGATVHLGPGVPRGRSVPSTTAELEPPYPVQRSGGLPPGRPHP